MHVCVCARAAGGGGERVLEDGPGVITSVPFPPGILEPNSASHMISLPFCKSV